MQAQNRKKERENLFRADYHVHSDWEPERNRTEKMKEYVQMAYSLGILQIGFAEHYWNQNFFGFGRWYRPSGPEVLFQIREAAEQLKLPEGMTIRVGCEAEYSKDAVIPLTREDLALLDYCILPHSHINMTGVVTDRIFDEDPEGCARFMLDSFMGVMRHPFAEHITILAHPFAPVGLEERQNEVLRYITDKEFRECARAARDLNIALEINSLTWAGKTLEELENSEFVRFYHIAKEEGCRFAYGSDCHGAAQYGFMPLAERIAELAGIGPGDFITQLGDRSRR